MFINILELNPIYDAITSAISGQHQGIFRSKAEEVRPFAESPTLNEDQINKAFNNVIPNDQKEALADPLIGGSKMRPLPFLPRERLDVVVDSSKSEQSEEISTEKTLNSPNPVMTTMGSVNFEEADPPMQNSIIPEYLKPTVGKSVSPKAQPDKPSAFDKLVDEVTRIMDSQGTALLTPDFWNWSTREEQKKDTLIDSNFMVGKEPVLFLNAQSVNPSSSIQEKGFVPLSSIQEEDKLNSAIHQHHIKKLTKSIISKLDEIDVNEYQEEVAKQYLSDLTKVNPIIIEICKEIFKERFSKELKIPNNYEADASSAITLSYPLALQYSIEVGGSPPETSRAVGEEAGYQRPLPPPPPLESKVLGEAKVFNNNDSLNDMNTNSGNVNNEKPSIISGLLGAMSSLSSGLSYLYLKFQEKIRKTPEASSVKKNSNIAKETTTPADLPSLDQRTRELENLRLTFMSMGRFDVAKPGDGPEKSTATRGVGEASSDLRADPLVSSCQGDVHKKPTKKVSFVETSIFGGVNLDNGGEVSGLVPLSSLQTAPQSRWETLIPTPSKLRAVKGLMVGPGIQASDNESGLAPENHGAGTKIIQRSEAFNAVVPKSSLHGIGTKQVVGDQAIEHS